MSEKVPLSTIFATAKAGVIANMSLSDGMEACLTGDKAMDQPASIGQAGKRAIAATA